MTDIITFLDNNGKYIVYTGGDIHGVYRYLETILDLTILTTSVQRSNHFRLSSSRNNDAELSSQLLQLFAQNRRVSVNAVEEFDTKLMHESSVVQNYSHQILGEI